MRVAETKHLLAISVVMMGFMAAGTARADTARLDPANPNQAGRDKKFVAAADEDSLAEIDLARLALKNSQNEDVRSFAEKMVQDHAKLMDAMKPFAANLGVPPPARLLRSGRDEMKRLSRKTGKAFDQDYLYTMLTEHHKDLAAFTKERDTTANADLKAAVGNAMGVMQEHTTMIEGLAKKYNVTGPAGARPHTFHPDSSPATP